jgi:hypothetical protein
MLAIELQALANLNFEVELTGFDFSEVDLIITENQDRAGGAEVSNGISECSRPAISQAGDQWVLGEHRLLCGDAGTELDCAATDAAIRRWQTFAGKSALLSDTGKTFADVQKERTSAVSRDASHDRSAAANREAA